MSSKSRTVKRSAGGRGSQSSWKELLPLKDGFLDSLGLFVALRIGVSGISASGGEELRTEEPPSFGGGPGSVAGSDIVVRLVESGKVISRCGNNLVGYSIYDGQSSEPQLNNN